MLYLDWLKRQYTDTWQAVAADSPSEMPFINFANSGISGGDDALAAYHYHARLDAAKGTFWRSDTQLEWGHLALREQLALMYGMPSPNNVLPVAGASQALTLAILAMSMASTSSPLTVCVESPTYAPLFEVPRYLGFKTHIFDRKVEDDYRLPIDAPVVSEGDLILLTNPNNPTGAHSGRERMIQFLNTASPKAVIIVDETFLPPYAAEQSAAHLMDNRVVVVGSLSKTLGLGALRCGWILARGEALDRLRIAWTLGFNIGSRLTESVAHQVLLDIATHQQRVQARLLANSSIVAQTLDELQDQGLLLWRKPVYNFTAFPELARATDTYAPQDAIAVFCDDLLRRERLAVIPGSWFDPRRSPGGVPSRSPSAHFRLGFGGETSATAAGMARLHRAIERWSAARSPS
jgi:aspartate/methionine/tyrosine aminotransferase